MTVIRGHRSVLFGAFLLYCAHAQAAVPFVQVKNPTGADTGLPYSYTLTAGNGTAPYGNWVITAGALPPGLSLNPATGTITGTVSLGSGSYNFSVTVNDAAHQASAARPLTLVVSPPVSITGPPALDEANAGAGYGPLFFTEANGSAPFVWTAKGLPSGMALGRNGALSGIPVTGSDGLYNPKFTVTDADGSTASVTLPLTVNGANPLSITTTSPLSSGIQGSDYPEQILTAAGGVGPYTFALTSGALPAGLNLVKGNIRGTPTVAGTFTVSVTVTDSLKAQAAVDLSISIKPSPVELLVSSGSMAFSLGVNAVNTPPVQRLTAQSTVVGQPLTYTVAVTPAAGWLSVTGGTTTPGVMNVSVTSAALALAAGAYQTAIVVTCTTTGCAGSTHTVTVTLNVTPAPGKLTLTTTSLAFTSDPSTSLPATQMIDLLNTGGLAANVTSITCGAPWCTVGAFPASLGGGAETQIGVTADPSRLAPGFYQSSVSVIHPAGRLSVPVSLRVPKAATMSLAPQGVTLRMAVGGTLASNNGSFQVVAVGGQFTWSAAASSTPAWLVANNASGIVAPGRPSVASYSINPTVAASLPAGSYYGAIQITAPGTANPTQEYRVVLDVTGSNDPVKPEPQPAGLQFLVAPGAPTPSQTIRIAAGSSSATKYQVVATTTSGGSWLTISPSQGSTSSVAADTTTVSVNAAGLSPGVYYGAVSFAFSAFGVRTVDVTLVVERSATATGNSAREGRRPEAASCTPTALAITQTALVSDFSQSASWPVPLTVGLVNDCGAIVPNGVVVATFTNGDPPLGLAVSDSGNGIYAGTWTPIHASAQVTVNLHASAAGLPAATAQLQGAVKANVVPVLTPHGTVNAFFPQSGASLAPGTVVAIYGSNLASTNVQPLSIPLTTSAGGATVVIGGIPAPLYYVSPGQINAMVPFELDPNGQYQIVVSAGGSLTMPDTLQMAPAGPGMAALPDGTVIALHSDGITPITETSPANQAETIVLYMVGMGQTDQTVTSGAASPVNPLARALIAPTVTIGNAPAQITYSGLTPGEVGLYQINAVVPLTTSDGDQPLTVSQNGVVTNLASLAVQ